MCVNPIKVVITQNVIVLYEKQYDVIDTSGTVFYCFIKPPLLWDSVEGLQPLSPLSKSFVVVVVVWWYKLVKIGVRLSIHMDGELILY